MALVNIAVELAKTGRRVLTVDFDLEAPGLDTFDIVRSENHVPGIIDFVGEYLESGQAPEVDRFIYRSSGVGDQGGGLWVMPSGAQRESYAANFSQIDWGVLYEKHDGYLLFEDLKEQWKRVIKPDYVLIDSRTGHTDTSGICTRQLPNAVAIFFFPNDQNLRGLTKVVKDIRSEARAPRNKEIDLHFVMSNVPDLDDEDRILEGKINAFQQQLGFEREPMIVHRYNSLALLNQMVFTKDRPRSRLAQEYRDVVRKIVSRNLADREGALDYIKRAGRRQRRGIEDEPFQEMDKTLQNIEDMHSSDGEVLFELGVLREEQRSLERAVSLFDHAIDVGYDEPDVYLNRARVRADSGDLDGANEDALQVLRSDRLPPPLVRAAIRLARPESPEGIAVSAAVTSLSFEDQFWLARNLYGSREETEIAVSILLPLISDGDQPEEERTSAKEELAMAYIGIGMYNEAVSLLRHGGRSVEEMNIRSAFNYGMAMWGKTDEIVLRNHLHESLKLDQKNPITEERPNYFQCMMVAYWASGDTATALEFEQRSRKAINARPLAFSSWRYRRATRNAFEEDLDEIHALIGGDASRTPQFMATAAEEDKNRKL